MYPFKLTITYDGTHYLGWQKTSMGPSIQETLERALFHLTQEIIVPEAASRTDRGVHAEAQVIAFSLQKPWEKDRLLKALNAHLPPDIRIKSVEKTDLDFHPTLHSQIKEYHYRLCLGSLQTPMHRLYSWHIPHRLNLTLMQNAAKQFLGKHDFTAFANDKQSSKEIHPICTLFAIDILPLEADRVEIRFQGDRFLYKMARNLTGTLVYIGSGKLDPDCVSPLFASKDRKKSGVTAPAHGLFLHRVVY